MKQRGRPVLGAIAGFLFGIFVSFDLVIFGVLPLDADALALVPLGGIAAGVLFGLTAPLRRRAAGQQPVRMPKPDPSAA